MRIEPKLNVPAMDLEIQRVGVLPEFSSSVPAYRIAPAKAPTDSRLHAKQAAVKALSRPGARTTVYGPAKGSERGLGMFKRVSAALVLTGVLSGVAGMTDPAKSLDGANDWQKAFSTLNASLPDLPRADAPTMEWPDWASAHQVDRALNATATTLTGIAVDVVNEGKGLLKNVSELRHSLPTVLSTVSSVVDASKQLWRHSDGAAQLASNAWQLAKPHVQHAVDQVVDDVATIRAQVKSDLVVAKTAIAHGMDAVLPQVDRTNQQASAADNSSGFLSRAALDVNDAVQAISTSVSRATADVRGSVHAFSEELASKADYGAKWLQTWLQERSTPSGVVASREASGPVDDGSSVALLKPLPKAILDKGGTSVYEIGELQLKAQAAAPIAAEHDARGALASPGLSQMTDLQRDIRVINALCKPAVDRIDCARRLHDFDPYMSLILAVEDVPNKPYFPAVGLDRNTVNLPGGYSIKMRTLTYGKSRVLNDLQAAGFSADEIKLLVEGKNKKAIQSMHVPMERSLALARIIKDDYQQLASRRIESLKKSTKFDSLSKEQRAALTYAYYNAGAIDGRAAWAAAELGRREAQHREQVSQGKPSRHSRGALSHLYEGFREHVTPVYSTPGGNAVANHRLAGYLDAWMKGKGAEVLANTDRFEYTDRQYVSSKAEQVRLRAQLDDMTGGERPRM